jgi:hypothetical protein
MIGEQETEPRAEGAVLADPAFVGREGALRRLDELYGVGDRVRRMSREMVADYAAADAGIRLDLSMAAR